MPKLKKTSHGFTLTEVMIVVAIIGILFVSLLTIMRYQRLKGQDAKMKDDLHLLKIAFENYYNDHNCYPPQEWFDSKDDCGQNYLSPYLQSIPCNPSNGLPYHLETDASDPSSCGGGYFKLYTNLNNPEDVEAQALWVDEGGNQDYNYGISSTNTTVEIANPNYEPSPSPESGQYYCRGWGNCIGPFPAPPCSVTFVESDCNNQCYNWDNICP